MYDIGYKKSGVHVNIVYLIFYEIMLIKILKINFLFIISELLKLNVHDKKNCFKLTALISCVKEKEKYIIESKNVYLMI